MSDMSQAAAAVWEKFIQLEQSDPTAKKILQKINNGAATYEDLQAFSNWMSTNLVRLASESFPEDSQEVLDALNDMSVCKNYFRHIDDAIKTVQKSMNEAAGIGLQPVSMNHPRQLLDATTSASDNYAADIQKFSQALIDTSQKHVDLAELKNARFQAGAGCEVTVTRKYDHVGLRNRKQACSWCLARVGTDVPYKEAVARGMFERHEGCGCTIIYHSEKGTFRQGSNEWQNNSWQEISDFERNRRISFSEGKQGILNRWDVKDVKSEYFKTFTPGEGTIKAEDNFKHDERPDEINCSRWLLSKFGGNIVLRAEVDEKKGVKSADYWWDGRLWDLKTPTGNGKRTIDNQFSKIADQIKDAPGGMIMDCSKLSFSDSYIIEHTAKRMNLNHFEGDVILKRGNNIIDILRYK